MHNDAYDAHVKEMHLLEAEIAALAPPMRRLIARLLRNDLDLLNVAAIDANRLEAELRAAASPLLARAERIHTVVGRIIGVKIHMLAPLVFDDPLPPRPAPE
jgi:hypothetical protein